MVCRYNTGSRIIKRHGQPKKNFFSWLMILNYSLRLASYLVMLMKLRHTYIRDYYYIRYTFYIQSYFYHSDRFVTLVRRFTLTLQWFGELAVLCYSVLLQLASIGDCCSSSVLLDDMDALGLLPSAGLRLEVVSAEIWRNWWTGFEKYLIAIDLLAAPANIFPEPNDVVWLRHTRSHSTALYRWVWSYWSDWLMIGGSGNRTILQEIGTSNRSLSNIWGRATPSCSRVYK